MSLTLPRLRVVKAVLLAAAVALVLSLAASLAPASADAKRIGPPTITSGPTTPPKGHEGEKCIAVTRIFTHDDGSLEITTLIYCDGKLVYRHTTWVPLIDWDGKPIG